MTSLFLRMTSCNARLPWLQCPAGPHTRPRTRSRGIPMRQFLPVALLSLICLSLTRPALAGEAKDPEPTVNTSPQTASLSVLLVTEGNTLLEDALKSLGLKQLVQMKPAEFDQAAPDKAGAR